MINTIHQVSELFFKASEAGNAGQPERARALYLECIRLFRSSLQDESCNIANIYNALAILEQTRGDFNAALDFACQAAAQFDPDDGKLCNQDGHEIRLETWGLLGNLQRQLALYPEAETSLLRALDFALANYGETDDETCTARNNLGILYKYTGQFEQAEKLYRAALEGALARHGQQNEFVATLYHNLGGLAHARGDFAGGLEDARQAWDIRRAWLGEDAPASLADAAAYAGLLDGLERYAESEPIYRRVLAAFEQLYGPEHYEIAVNLNNLAAVRYARGDAREAEQLYRRALAIKEKILGPEHPDTALTANNLGVLLHQLGRVSEARYCFSLALGVFENVYGPEHPKTRMAVDNLAALE